MKKSEPVLLKTAKIFTGINHNLVYQKIYLFIRKIVNDHDFDRGYLRFRRYKGSIHYDHEEGKIIERDFSDILKSFSKHENVFYTDNKPITTLVIPVLFKNSPEAFFVFECAGEKCKLNKSEVREFEQVSDYLSHIFMDFDLWSRSSESRLLRQGRTIYSDYLENSVESIVITDHKGNIEKANSNFRALLGISGKKMRSKVIFDLAPDFSTVLKSQYDQLWKRGFSEGEVILRDSSGKEIFVSIEGILSQNRQAVFFLKDMSHWMDMLTELANSEYKFKLLFDSSPVGKEIYDVKGRLIRINSAGLANYGVENPDHLREWNILREVELTNELKEKLARGETVHITKEVNFDALREDRLTHTVMSGKKEFNIKITSINSYDYSRNHYLFQVTDKSSYISEELFSGSNQFISHLAHEIRTPLNTIIGMVELLKDADEEERATFIRLLDGASDYLYSLINDILDLSRLDSTEFRIDLREFSIRDLVDDIAELFEVRTREKGIRLITDYSEDLPEKLINDTYRIRQVLFNLIG
ncbi:MAG: histidine kinase dimerization/phospho-acceptor domain-containing protein, partial [Candidatus Muiribacteriaceae bacterium]